MKKIRKILALVIAVTLMAGSSMTVLAQEDGAGAPPAPVGPPVMADIYTYNPNTLVIEGHEMGEDGSMYLVPVNEISGGSFLWFIYGVELYVNGERTLAYDNGSYYEYAVPEGGIWAVTVSEAEDGTVHIFLYNSSQGDSAGNSTVADHAHDFQWIITVDPTDTEDGLSEYICKNCPATAGSQPVSKAFVWVKNIIEQIENAPEGGTVVVETDMYFCYTAKIIEALLARPDVTLETHFTDEAGNRKGFIIPAGQAPADGAQFYGFIGLGNRYGWLTLAE